MAKSGLQKDIYPILPPSIVKVLNAVSSGVLNKIIEVRLRAQRPLQLITDTFDFMLNEYGKIVYEPNAAYCVSSEDINRALQLISQNSLYAFEEELRLGYITIRGGHRIGLAGKAIVENGHLKALQQISSLNIRISREVIGCADKLMPYIISNKQVLSTLLISAPRCGKTTLLRDIARLLSTGSSELKFGGVQVGIVDERSEIAACDQGIPTVNMGPKLDVLDGCPKASGMLMLIRSMAPQVIITDELGRMEDTEAIREAVHAGVSVISTVHGYDLNDIMRRPYIGELIQEKAFDRYVMITNQSQIGTISKIMNSQGAIIYNHENSCEQSSVLAR